MSSQTTGDLHLVQPAYTDTADIAVINANMQTIDTAVTGKKPKQSAVSDPTASGSATSFIDTITQNANGVITPTKKNLPVSTSGALGCVKVGYTTSGKNYKVQVDGSGNAYVNVPWTDTVYSLPTASSSTKGGIKLGYTNSGKNYKVQVDSSGNAYVNVPWTDTTYSVATTSANGLMSKDDKIKLNGIAANANNYSLPLSASGTRGGIQIGFTQTGKKYPVQLSSEKAYVEVPWVNTTYSAATTSAAGLMSATDKTKLNGISTAANKITFYPSTVPLGPSYTINANNKINLSISVPNYSYNFLSITGFDAGNDFVTVSKAEAYVSGSNLVVNLTLVNNDSYSRSGSAKVTVVGYTIS